MSHPYLALALIAGLLAAIAVGLMEVDKKLARVIQLLQRDPHQFDDDGS